MTRQQSVQSPNNDGGRNKRRNKNKRQKKQLQKQQRQQQDEHSHINNNIDNNSTPHAHNHENDNNLDVDSHHHNNEISHQQQQQSCEESSSSATFSPIDATNDTITQTSSTSPISSVDTTPVKQASNGTQSIGCIPEDILTSSTTTANNLVIVNSNDLNHNQNAFNLDNNEQMTHAIIQTTQTTSINVDNAKPIISQRFSDDQVTLTTTQPKLSIDEKHIVVQSSSSSSEPDKCVVDQIPTTSRVSDVHSIEDNHINSISSASTQPQAEIKQSVIMDVHHINSQDIQHADLSKSVDDDIRPQINQTKGETFIDIRNNVQDEESDKRRRQIKAKLREFKKLQSRFESQSSHMTALTEHIKQQANKIKELEGLVLNSKKSFNQLERMLQHESTCRAKSEQEKTHLSQTVNRLKTQISIYEKNKLTNDELLRTINATLMERETEVSMLKLKLTRLQTNTQQSSNMSLTNYGNSNLTLLSSTTTQNNQISADFDPRKAFIHAGRSNSEFQRNTSTRSTMIADASARSTSQLRSIDNDSSVWASIPVDLTPSKRPQLLEKSFQAIFNESRHNQQQHGNTSSTPLCRDKRYKTLPPRAITKSSDVTKRNSEDKTTIEDTTNNQSTTIPATIQQNINNNNTNQCRVTNLDDSSTSGNKSSSINSGTLETSMQITSSSTQQPITITTTTTPPAHKELRLLTTSSPSLKLSEVNRKIVENYTKDITTSNNHKNITQQNSTASSTHKGIFTGSSGNLNTNHKKSKTDVNNFCNKNIDTANMDTETYPCPRDDNGFNIQNPEPIRESTKETTHFLNKDQPSPHVLAISDSSPFSTPTKKSSGLKRILHKFRRSDSNSSSKNDVIMNGTQQQASFSNSPFKRDSNRATLVGLPGDGRAQMSPKQQKISFHTDKSFADWDTHMIVEWLTMIGLSMYSNQCRRWVKCGAHIMNATPAEVDKGLGITNHLHRKKLRLAISELNGDCDKVTKAAAKLDYLWIARWLDDIGLPQYKEAFINGRVDGRVLNYLTVEDLVSLGVKSVLHHASIRCGIRVLRSINFDLQLLKRRATAEEIEDMNTKRQHVNHVNESITLKHALGSQSNETTSSTTAYTSNTDLSLWTCHRLMEWLRLIDFAEFAPNLRGSGVHGGLLVLEDAFNFDTMCSLLSIPLSRTLLRRHLSSYFDSLIGKDLVQKKRQYQDVSPHPHLNPLDEIKTVKKGPLWPLTKLKSSSKVAQDGMDNYLCPMYPMEPQIIKITTSPPLPPTTISSLSRQPLRNEIGSFQSTQLTQIPESVNV